MLGHRVEGEWHRLSTFKSRPGNPYICTECETLVYEPDAEVRPRKIRRQKISDIETADVLDIREDTDFDINDIL